MSSYYPNELNGKPVITIQPIKQFKQEQQLTKVRSFTTEQKIFTKKKELEQLLHEIEIKRLEKERLIEETKEQIKIEKQKWESEKQKLIERAKEEGYEQGFISGEQDGLEQYEGHIQQAASIINSAKEDYHQTVEKSTGTILNLAVHTAEKILATVIADKPEDFIHLVKEAVKTLKDRSVISIYLHPLNYEYVLQQKSELERLIDHDMLLTIHMNEELRENSCMIEHPFGKIDASIDTQLQQVREKLMEVAMEE